MAAILRKTFSSAFFYKEDYKMLIEKNATEVYS